MRTRFSRTPHSHPVVRFLDDRLFPLVVTLMTSRAHILFLLCLLLIIENPTMAAVIMLMAGNWTNVVSASASAIVLRQQSTQHEEVIDRHESHADAFEQILTKLDAMHAEMHRQQEEDTQS